MNNSYHIYISKENEQQTIASLKAWGGNSCAINGLINGDKVSLVECKGDLDKVILNGFKLPIPVSEESSSLRVVPSNSGDSWIVKLDEDDWGLLANDESDLNKQDGDDYQFAMFFNVETVDGLEKFRNINSLILSGSVEDISPIGNLTNLTNLFIYDCNTKDLSPLDNLINLTSLKLCYTYVSDLSPLKSLINLTELSLCQGDIIQDISSLKYLINLKVLDLSYTEITDLSPLKNLSKLKSLDLSNCNGVSDLSPLKGLTNLRVLDVYEAECITNIFALEGMKISVRSGVIVL